MRISKTLLGVLTCWSLGLAAQPAATADITDLEAENIRISLITCTPHEEIYSLYGHTAIRIEWQEKRTDAAVNYGVFDFSDTGRFVWNFIMGHTDYSVGAMPFSMFCKEYHNWGSAVYQQVLNLTPREKRRIMEAIEKNMLPENRIYRYNYFYTNCTTKARDIIEDNIDGNICWHTPDTGKATFREMIHHYNGHHPWARFGNDILLGFGSDRPTTRSDQQFLPENLMNDFNKAEITDTNGQRRKLVSETITAVKQGVQEVESDFPLTPTACALILLGIVLTSTLAECRWSKVNLWGLDLALMLLCGIAGIVLTLMLFSEHPTVSRNLQILLLNPLPLLMAWPVCRKLRQRRCHWFIYVAEGLTLAFLAGAFLQQYAEGMIIVALSLLIRQGKSVIMTHIDHDVKRR